MKIPEFNYQVSNGGNARKERKHHISSSSVVKMDHIHNDIVHIGEIEKVTEQKFEEDSKSRKIEKKSTAIVGKREK